MIDVRDDPDQSCFRVSLDGEDVGSAFYQLRPADETRPERVVFTHTRVSSEVSGRGVGGALARGALDAVRASGRRAVVVCPFIAAFISKHPEYQDLVVAS
ncbi:hypothetical protein SAMN05892883_0968 [Jatrophihabitans sp. GAS493]|uniref:GNAT family N-acetyltransferase n=1 Tax=Jatrophihabitans sp. GAS493 TaxID=1907575 RepID=UPI000BB67802|nr:GNAT family N-acetyltransferase [Jatrophihabitans sp. GAS493]SOD71447.1 hypothetical protein SAMN05892883_0968 [Jatrophihabitans sp. GAS493]